MIKLQGKKHFKITYSLVLNAVIMAFFLLFFQLHYEMPDDFVFSNLITNGSYNFSFMSPIMASIIGFFQRFLYPANAYVIVCLICAFVACVSITRVFIDKFSPITAFCFTIVLNGFLGINHFGTIAYTRMAALMSVAGLLCIIHYSNREKWKLGVCIGIILLIFGSIFRFAIFEVAVAAGVFFVLGKSVADYFSKDKKTRKFFDLLKITFEPKRLISALIAIVICFSVYYISSFVIKSDKRVDYFIKYTAARSAVYDYKLPEYETHKEDYSKIDIDENDLFMLRNLYMDDEGAFTIDKLKEIRSIKNAADSSESSFLGNMKLMLVCEAGNIRAVWKNGTIDIRNFGIMAGNKGIMYFFIGVLLFVFFVSMKKRNYFIPVALMIISFAVYAYLWQELKVPFRAVYPVLISFAVYLSYSFSLNGAKNYIKEFFNEKRRLAVSAVVILSMIFAGMGIYLTTIYNQYIDYYTLSDSQRALRNYLDENKNTNKKFALSNNCSYGALTDSIWLTEKTDKNKNYNNFAGTYYRLPQTDLETKWFGTDNMFKYLYNDNVYYVVDFEDSHADNMKNYLQKYYSNGKTVDYKIVDTVDRYQICKYTLK